MAIFPCSVYSTVSVQKTEHNNTTTGGGSKLRRFHSLVAHPDLCLACVSSPRDVISSLLTGHGGRAAAIFTRDHLFELVVAELQSGQEPSQALTRAYLNTDKRFIAACRGVNEAESNQSTQTPTMPSTPTLPNAAPQRRQQSANLAVKIPVSLPVAATNSRSTSAASGAEILEKDTSGTTAVCVLLHHETYQLYVGNVGDSVRVIDNRRSTSTWLRS